jgi:PHD/YefM family antitoxin component YafN of YafNO toxin-antitoxin module
MNTIPAQEIKRLGIAAVDSLLVNRAVHVIQDDEPHYVVLSEERYRELVEAQEEAFEARLLASQEDVKASRVKRGTADDLLKELGLDT